MAESGVTSHMDKQNSLLASLSDTSAEAAETLGDEVVKEIYALMKDEKETGAGAPFCPIAYGSIAFKLKAPPKKPDEEEAPVARATHRWTLYVRGIHGADISYAIREVEFKLHETFPDPIRTVTAPPFEISDEGWGEFEAIITVRFHDESLHPVRFAHHLRLHPQPGQAASHPPEAPVIHEFYDEIVFNSPAAMPPAVAEALGAGPQLPPSPHALAHHFKVEDLSPEADLAQLAAAQAFVAQETARLTERLARADAEAVEVTRDLEALGWSTAKSTRGSTAPVSDPSRRRR